MLTPSEDDMRLLDEIEGHMEAARGGLRKLGNRLDSRFSHLDLQARNALLDARGAVAELKKQVQRSAGAVPGQKPLAQAFKPV